jgi:restriction system protein
LITSSVTIFSPENTEALMRNYYRVMLGRKSVCAQACFDGNFIGADYDVQEDLTGKLPEASREFNDRFVPVFLSNHPNKTRIAAGLSCAMLWTLAKGMAKGSLVLCPDGSGRYRVAEIVGDYYYAPGEILPHRRPVQWLTPVIERTHMTESLRNSISSIATVVSITKEPFIEEIEGFIGGTKSPSLIATDSSVEDPIAFAMERHLEDFLVANWSNTELGRHYDIYEEDGELVGQQYPTDTGPLDVLAVSKDRKTLLVVELKRGKASDVVVGQTLRYMGYVQEELAEEGQSVRGVIIALEDDQRIRRALAMTPTIEFFRYEISFKLVR